MKHVFPTRKGYKAIAVDYRDGRPRVTQWEKIGKEPPAEPGNQPDSKPVKRGVLAAERPPQDDLFGRD